MAGGRYFRLAVRSSSERSGFSAARASSPNAVASAATMTTSSPCGSDPLASQLTRMVDSPGRRHQRGRSGITSAKAARHVGGSKGSAKYCVSWVTEPRENSIMLTESVGTPS